MRTQRQGPCGAAPAVPTAPAAAVLFLVLAAGAVAAADTSAPGSLLNAANVEKAVSSFMQLVKQPYSMQGLWGVSPEQVQQLGVGAPWVQAAAEARSAFRQSLLAGGSAGAGAELAARLSNGTLLPRLLSSGMPLKLSADGKGIELPGLQAIGAFLSQRVQEALKGKAAGLADTHAGRRLLEVQGGGDEQEDAASGDTLLQALHNIERIRGYMARLAGAAGDALDTAASAQRAADGEFTDDEDAVPQGSHRRRLQQGGPLGGPLGGLDGPLDDDDDNKDYGDAIRLIFTNVFDLFRANGLYALVPIIADLRGIFNRYNFIADLFNILDAPLENFVNANYWPLPQSNEDFIELVRRFADDYCSVEEASSSEDVLGEFEGPSLTYEVSPVSCPIYADPVTGRSYVSFGDCDPATLTISVAPLTITEAYFSAASYTGAECKLTERFGTDLELTLGGGGQEFTFRRTAQGLTITPTVIQWNSDFSFFPNNIEEEDEEQPTGGTVTVVAEAQESSDPDENFFDPPVVGGDDGGDDGGDAEGGDDGGGDDGARK